MRCKVEGRTIVMSSVYTASVTHSASEYIQLAHVNSCAPTG